MNEQTRKHLDEINGISNDPELVAVVQLDEATDDVVVLLNNQTIEDGGEVDYMGKQFPVTVEVLDEGVVPDEIDMGTIIKYVSTEAYDHKHKTIVTTSVPVYGTKPGRTVEGADVVLSVGGVAIEQEPDDAGHGSRVDCSGVILRRWRFVVPNTVWGFKAGKTRNDE
jgi:hypothetical protein